MPNSYDPSNSPTNPNSANGSQLPGTIGGTFEPFKKYVKDQLRVRKALISHAQNVKYGSYNWQLSQDLNNNNQLESDEVIRQGAGTWADVGTSEGNFDLDGRGVGFVEDEAYGQIANVPPDIVAASEEEGYGLKYDSEQVTNDTFATNAFYAYTVEKQSFIRMMSGVDIIDKDLLDSHFLESTQVNAFGTYYGNQAPNNPLTEVDMFGDSPSPAGTYTLGGSRGGNPLLAKFWTLQGGTLGSTVNQMGFQPGEMGSSYGDPTIRSNADNDYGIVPMPGIVDAEIRTKGKHGALREAQVNFVCHNRRQLDILETLYMRPGHYIALEWGWNPYIDNRFARQENNYSIADDFFHPGTDGVEELNQKIKKYKEDSFANYDGFVGICKNFKYKARKDGGFDCTTQIMAGGEIMESLQSRSITKKTGRKLPSRGDFELETMDSLLYYLRSIKKNLNKASDAMYIKTPEDERENLNLDGDNPVTLLYGEYEEGLKEKIISQFISEGRSIEMQQAIAEAEYMGDRCPAQHKGLFLRLINYRNVGWIECSYNKRAYDDEGKVKWFHSNDIVVNVIPYNNLDSCGDINPVGYAPDATNQQIIEFKHEDQIPKARRAQWARRESNTHYNPIPDKAQMVRNQDGDWINQTYSFEGGYNPGVVYEGEGISSEGGTAIGEGGYTDIGWTVDELGVRVDQEDVEASIANVVEEYGTSYAEQDLIESHHYKKGLDDIIELYKFITKQVQVPSELHAEWGSLPNENITPYGFDLDAGEGLESMLGNTILKQIVKYAGDEQGEENGDTGYRKNIYVRWDLLCQIINHLSTYKYSQDGSFKETIRNGGTLKNPITELTYLTENQKTWTNRAPEDGRENAGYEGSRYYLRYSAPSIGVADPKIEQYDYWKKDGMDPIEFPSQAGRPNPNDPDVTDSELFEHEHGRAPTETELEEYSLKRTYAGSYTGNYHPQLGASFDHRVCLLPHMPIFHNMFIDGALSHDDDFRDEEFERAVQEDVTNIRLHSYKEKPTDVNKTHRHSVGFIYFNLDYIIEVYESMRLNFTKVDRGIVSYNYTTLNDDFNLLDYIKNIWDGVNDATANYYNFGLNTEHERPNICRIIDHRVSGVPPMEHIYTFEPFGLRSVTRDFFYESKISNRMSSAIAIAALDPNNINDVESLGFKAFNRNIISRFTDHDNSENRRQQAADAARDTLKNDVELYEKKSRSLNYYLYKLNLGNFVTGFDFAGHDDGTIALINHSEAKITAKDLRSLRTKILNRYPLTHEKAGQWREKTTQEQSEVIPISVNLMLDGIAGMHPLRMFRIAENRLPLAYRRDDIGFIIVKESHKLTSSQDWTVSIEGKFYLLDVNPNNEGPQSIEIAESTNEQTDDLNEEEDLTHDNDIHFTADDMPPLTQEHIDAITDHEGFRKYAYKNRLRRQNGTFYEDRWTIGIGFTSDVSNITGCEDIGEIVNDGVSVEQKLLEFRPGNFATDLKDDGSLMWPNINAVIGGRQDGQQGRDFNGGPLGTRSLSIEGTENEARMQAQACLENALEAPAYGGRIKGWMRHYDRKFTLNEYAALVSFIYNTGGGTFKCGNSNNVGTGADSDGSAISCIGNRSMMYTELFINDDHPSGAFQIADGWDTSLVYNRRLAEQELFNRDADYHESGTGNPSGLTTDSPDINLTPPPTNNYNPNTDPFNVDP